MGRRRLPIAVPLALAAILLAPAAPAGAVRDADPGPDGFRLVAVRGSLLGTHEWYEQTWEDLPVVDGYLARHVAFDGTVLKLDDGRRPIVGDPTLTTGVLSVEAEVLASERVGGAAAPAQLAVLASNPARLVWVVVSSRPSGSVRTIIDAANGRVVRVEPQVRHATGTGRVFDPNPVVTLQDPTLADANDQATAVLGSAYRTVSLSRLDGSGYLTGEFATISVKKNEAFEPSLSFVYDRSNDRFEQVMAYHQVTEAQEYIQSLGFADVNNRSTVLKPNGTKGDTSWYDTVKETITYGSGGVDDAEDADVIWHEYGHAIQDDQVPGFGKGHDSESIGEGFSDYWAFTMSVPVNGGYDLGCIADWDAVSYSSSTPPCLRRVDTDLTVADFTGQIHHDGQVWSRALYDLHQALGRAKTDTIVLESQFLYAKSTSFADAARDVVSVARALYGPHAEAVALEAFTDRGIL